MTTAFQTVIDNAESISINKKRKVGQTVSRSGVVKSTSFGGQIWEFVVKLPDGPKWTDYRSAIENMEALDRVSEGTIQINKNGHSWINGYLGDETSTPTSITASYTSGNTITLSSGVTIGSGFVFRSGDLIQLGSSGSVYSVVGDVAYNQSLVTLHRPVLEAAGSYTLRVGQNVTWTVICSNFPNWNLFAYNQVAWDGSFVFVEAI